MEKMSTLGSTETLKQFNVLVAANYE